MFLFLLIVTVLGQVSCPRFKTFSFLLIVQCLESVDLGTDVNEKMLSLTVEMWDCGGRAVSTTWAVISTCIFSSLTAICIILVVALRSCLKIYQLVYLALHVFLCPVCT